MAKAVDQKILLKESKETKPNGKNRRQTFFVKENKEVKPNRENCEQNVFNVLEKERKETTPDD